MENSLQDLDYVEDGFGRRMYYKYTPAELESDSPLLVILHGHTFNAKPSRYKNKDVNVLAPIDNFGVDACGSWWLGERGDFFVRDLLQKLIIEKRKKTNGKLFFWGSSMGGFGALIHGLDLAADAVYANIPQIRLLGSTYSERGMKKFFEPIFSGLDSSPYNNLVEYMSFVLQRKEVSDLPLFFIAQSRFDYDSYLEEQSLYFFKACVDWGVNVHYEVFPEKGHSLMMPANEAIDKMLRYFASDNPEGVA